MAGELVVPPAGTELVGSADMGVELEVSGTELVIAAAPVDFEASLPELEHAVNAAIAARLAIARARVWTRDMADPFRPEHLTFF